MKVKTALNNKTLEKSNIHPDILFQTVPCVIFTVDTNRNITTWNPEAEEVTGYTVEEIIGKPCTVFAKKPCEEKCGLLDMDVKKPVKGRECTIITKAGNERTILKNVDTLMDENGDIVGGIESFIDITNLKKIELELLENKENLEKKINQRTTELTVINKNLEREIDARKKNERQLNHLSVMRKDLVGPKTMAEKLASITDGVVDIFDADFARIWITQQGDRCDMGCIHAEVTDRTHVCEYRDRCLHLKASSGRYTHIDGEVHRRVPYGCYKIGRIASGEETKFITNDVTKDPRVHNHDWAEELGLVSFAGYRLTSSEGKPIGVLALFSKNTISLEDNILLEDIATTASQVIQAAWIEEELLSERAQLLSLFDGIDDVIYVADPETHELVYVNSSFKKIWGENVIGEKCYHVLQGRDAPCPFCTNEKVFGDYMGKSYVWEFQNEVTGRYFRCADKAIKWSDGRWTRFEMASDITEQKQAQDELKTNEKRLKALLELSQMKDMDDQSISEYALEEAANLTKSQVGYLHFFKEDEKTIELSTWTKSVLSHCTTAKDDHYHLDKAGIWADCIRQRKPVIHNDYDNIVGKNGLPEGHFPIFRHMSVPVFDGGTIVAVAGVGNKKTPYSESDVRQISLLMNSMWRIRKQRHAEKALQESEKKYRELNRTLEERVQKRTAELESSMKEMEDFTYSISHYLRQPLRAIDAFSNILTQEHSSSLDGEGHRLLNVINNNIKRMGRLLDDLLMFARLKRKTFTPSYLDMTKLANDAFNKMRIDSNNKEITLTIDTLPNARGDKEFIGIVLKNLISNAVKFQKNGIRPIVAVGGLRNGDLNTYYVKDSGIGFDMKYKDKLFGVFERLHGPEEYGGTGMGLALVQQIIRQHGGSVWAEGKENNGAAFYFSLPNTEKTDG